MLLKNINHKNVLYNKQFKLVLQLPFFTDDIKLTKLHVLFTINFSVIFLQGYDTRIPSLFILVYAKHILLL